MRYKIELEYCFQTSPRVLFSRLSTVDGLAEWFADSVDSKKELFTFTWEGEQQSAKLVSEEKDKSISFQWVEDEGEDYFFGFTINIDPLTNELALIVTDYVDEDDEDDAVELWDKQINELQSTLGAK
jgi:uncharacterized protein YndB with AHSA1/START domain